MKVMQLFEQLIAEDSKVDIPAKILIYYREWCNDNNCYADQKSSIDKFAKYFSTEFSDKIIDFLNDVVTIRG